MVIIPRKEEVRGLSGAPKGSIKETKRAVVFATLGIPLDPVTGILVLCSESADRLDGEAYYSFNVPLDNWDRVNEIYSAGTADVELDAAIDRLKADPNLGSIATELERSIGDALIVYGRRFLENYQRMVQCLMKQGRDITIKDKPKGAYEFRFFLERNK